MLYEHGLVALKSSVPMGFGAPVAAAPAPARWRPPRQRQPSLKLRLCQPARACPRWTEPRSTPTSAVMASGLLRGAQALRLCAGGQRADGLEALQQLGLELVEKVSAAKGPQAALGVRRAGSNGRMPPRLFVDGPLPSAGDRFALPRLPATCRCCACSRVTAIVLFDGSGPEWPATVTAMGRQSVEVELGAQAPRSVS